MSGLHLNMAHYEIAALAKCPDSDATWRIAQWERVGDYNEVRLGPTRPLLSGPRKGQPKWDVKALVRVILSDPETEAAMAAWSERTGLCPQCLGDGGYFMGWSKEHGTKWKPCIACGKDRVRP